MAEDWIDHSSTHTLAREPAGEALSVRRIRFSWRDEAGEHVEELEHENVTLGSRQENDIHVRDRSVSRAHCRFFVESGRTVVQDLGTTNGTFLDGLPIREAFVDDPDVTLTLGTVAVRVELRQLSEPLPQSPTTPLPGLVGRSEAMERAFALVERIARTDATVMIQGETGTGKELIARALHHCSKRKDGPLIVFDCASAPASLIESHLFGHERGAFTGADRQHIGVFEAAQGGTLFIDEIGELPLDLQPRLLRALERREIRRVGGDQYRALDVRVVTATHRDLLARVEQGTFRQDLYYRLDVVCVPLPPLRERTADIAPLVEHFLAHGKFNQDEKGNRRMRGVAPAVIASLETHDWPGNVRELAHVVERAVAIGDGPFIKLQDLPERLFPTAMLPAASDETPASFAEARDRWMSAFAQQYLERILSRHNGDVDGAAREAEVHPKYFRRLARRFEVDL